MLLQAPLTVYGSSETHNCVIKGVEVIGIGSESFQESTGG